jgi:hypothetical protein
MLKESRVTMKKLFEGYLLVSDLDGTLLDENKQISKQNQEAIEYFVREGGHFTIATGRRTSFAYQAVKELPITLPVILYNGALLYEYSSQKALKFHYLEEEGKKLVTTLAKKYENVGVHFYIEEEVCLYQEAKSIAFELKDRANFLSFDESMLQEGKYKNWRKIFFLGKIEEIDVLEEDLATNYAHLEIARSGEYSVEILPKGVSKGRMLEVLTKEYGIDPQKVIAIGDNMNDEQMLLFAGHGFVVENADARLKQKITKVAPHHNQHAIEYVVKEMAKLLDSGM